MAGSYGHVAKDNGGWSLIENMGDAHEAVEELLWLVESRIGRKEAILLLHNEFYPQQRGEMPNDEAMVRVKAMMSR